MNPATLSIYSELTPSTPPHTTSIQLAITHQIESLVKKRWGDQPRPDIPVYLSYQGKFVLGPDSYTILDRIDGSGLLQTINNWNDRSTVTGVSLDQKTTSLANSIEQIMTSTSNNLPNYSTSAAEIPTDIDRIAYLSSGRITHISQGLQDPTTGEPLFVMESEFGKKLIDQISDSLINNDSGHPDIYIIKAPPGSGKTHLLATIAKIVVDAGKYITFASARQQLTQSLADDLVGQGVVGEQDILVGTSRKQPKQRPSDEYHVTATTINSMQRLCRFTDEFARRLDRLNRWVVGGVITEDQYNTEKKELNHTKVSRDFFSIIQKQDVLVVDEAQLLRSNLICGTHISDDDAYWIRDRLRMLEEQSRVIIMLDADVDPSLVEYHSINHTNSKINIYSFFVPETRQVHVHPNSTSLKHWLINEIKSVPKKTLDQLTPASFAIPCTSTKDGKWLYHAIMQLRPDLKVIWICASNKQEDDQQAILKDSMMAYEYDVILYSPTIFTGFSFDSTIVNKQVVPVASRVVGVFGGQKIGWMERAQALFRIRNCQEFHFDAGHLEEEDEEETNIITEVALARQQMFDCDQLRVPMPIVECSNKDMTLYFRSRGFKMVEHDTFTLTRTDVVAIKSSSTIKKTRITKPRVNNKQVAARRFVEIMLDHWKVDRSVVGECVIFEGQLEQEFSKTMDQFLAPESEAHGCVLTTLPKWKRRERYDMRTIAKMFAVADINVDADITYRNYIPKSGGKREIYKLVITTKPTDQQ